MKSNYLYYIVNKTQNKHENMPFSPEQQLAYDKYVKGENIFITGNTIVDIDTSYGYYFDSGSRVHKIVHNIYELFNFCAISEIGLKSFFNKFFAFSKMSSENFEFFKKFSQFFALFGISAIPP